MDLHSSFLNIISSHTLHGNHKFLVAVSGGVDSVVLAELCKRAGYSFAIAHCNFQLRGTESERDEGFVKALAENYSVPVFIKKFDTKSYAEENSLSIQEAARKLRYDFFQKLITEHQFSYTLLAHHADDQIETLLMNFFRGCGIEGLTGMPVLNVPQARTLRPLLHMRRDDILAFAKDNNLQWVEDSSNSESKYSRNFFRNELLPQIKTIYPNAEVNLLHNIDRLIKTNTLYKSLAAEFIKKIAVVKGEELHIPVMKLTPYVNTSLIYELIKNYGFGEKQVREIEKLLQSESGKFIANESYQIIRHRRWLIIAPVAPASETLAIKAEQELVLFAGGTLKLRLIKSEKFQLNKAATIAQLDANEIDFPLLLRRWKQGDYFYPLGMRKKKKIARFLIDQKLSKSAKENVWVLESHKKIIWIIGQRIDDRFKVTDKTKQVLEITWSNL